MSAITRLNGTRAQSNTVIPSHNDIRDKVASLIRQEKNGAPSPLAPHPRPAHDEGHPLSLPRAERAETTGRELSGALDILSRATSCFDLLTRKLDQVEGERDEMQAQLEEHKRAALTWAGMIENVQGKLRTAERDLADMRQEMAAQQARTGEAEERADHLENALKQRDRRLADLEGSYGSLHDQVMSSFGRGSATYRTLESLVDRFHADVA